jgi:hypothetical protein
MFMQICPYVVDFAGVFPNHHSLIKNWKAEIKKWLGDERLKTYAVDKDLTPEAFTKYSSQVGVINLLMFTPCVELSRSPPLLLLVYAHQRGLLVVTSPTVVATELTFTGYIYASLSPRDRRLPQC